MKTPGPPTRAAQAPTVMQPPKSNVGLIVGIAASALVLVGGVIGVVVWQQGESTKQQERLAHLAAQRAAEDARKQAEAAAAREKEAGDAAPVFLSVVSDPLGAKVEATWKGGQKTGETPLELEVPKNVKVHFAFTRQGYLPYSEDVIADSAQVVKAPLTQEPKVTTSGAARSPPRERRARGSSADPSNDSTIPVEF
jgi:hypothetical protein